jgi:DNA-binding MarR family transcriptional regulator
MDWRGIYVMLTEAGQRRHAEAVPAHRDVHAHTHAPRRPESARARQPA